MNLFNNIVCAGISLSGFVNHIKTHRYGFMPDNYIVTVILKFLNRLNDCIRS